MCALGRRAEDDRDHYGNKRLDLAGPLLGGLFRMVCCNMLANFSVFISSFFFSWELNYVLPCKISFSGNWRGMWGHMFRRLLPCLNDHALSLSQSWLLTAVSVESSVSIMGRKLICNLLLKLKPSLVDWSIPLLLETGDRLTKLVQEPVCLRCVHFHDHIHMYALVQFGLANKCSNMFS